MKFVLIILSLFIISPLFAQKQYINTKIGISVSNTDPHPNLFLLKSSKARFMFEMNYEIELINKVSFLCGINSQKITEFFIPRINRFTSSGYNVYEYRFVSYPFKLKYTTGKKMYTYASIGFMPSFLREAKLIQEKSITSEIRTEYHRDLFGLAEVGAGYIINNSLKIAVYFIRQHNFKENNVYIVGGMLSFPLQ